jgi:hypothetical protein
VTDNSDDVGLRVKPAMTMGGGVLRGLLSVWILLSALICHRQGFLFCHHKRNQEKPSHNKDLAHD